MSDHKHTILDDAQVVELKVPPVPQVTVNVAPFSRYPVSQVTFVVEPVVPVMAPLADLSEFGT